MPAEVVMALLLALIGVISAVAFVIRNWGKKIEGQAQQINAFAERTRSENAAGLEMQRMIQELTMTFMGQVKDVRAQFDSLNRLHTILREDFAKVSMQNEMRGSTVERLEERLTQAERARTKSEENQIALMSKVTMVDVLRGQVEQLRSDMLEHGHKLDEAKRREMELSQKNIILAERNLRADEEKSALQIQVGELQSKVAELQQRIYDLETQIHPAAVSALELSEELS